MRIRIEFITFIVLTLSASAEAQSNPLPSSFGGVPAELRPLEEELNDIAAANLEAGIRYSRGAQIGTQNRAESPRYRTSEQATGYLNHDETSFESQTTLPFEYYGRLSKERIEESYLNDSTLQERSETALNSTGAPGFKC